MGRVGSIGRSFKQALAVPGVDERAEDEQRPNVATRRTNDGLYVDDVGSPCLEMGGSIRNAPTTVFVGGPIHTAMNTNAIRGLIMRPWSGGQVDCQHQLA